MTPEAFWAEPQQGDSPAIFYLKPSRCPITIRGGLFGMETGSMQLQITQKKKCLGILMVAMLYVALLSPGAARAAAQQVRVPLHEGKLCLVDLSTAFAEHPTVCSWLPGPKLEFDMRGVGANRFISAMGGAFKDGCKLSVDADGIVFCVDPALLPANCDAAKTVVRVFTALAAPDATAALRKHWGLHLPDQIDPHKPLVVLIHGLDCGPNIFGQLTSLLNDAGYQTATFGYPSDGPIVESAALLGEALSDVRTRYPELKVDIIAHSLGALVSRAYVEGDHYNGMVDRLIMMTPPNHGSDWTKFSLLMKVRENLMQWKYDKDYSATWFITEGLGEAVRDMKPGSEFLTTLNEQPRRAGLKYTIIAGSQHPAWRLGASVVSAPANWVPKRIENVWGIRQARSRLEKTAESMRNHSGSSDGPVTVESAKLTGVDDLVVLPTDHCSMYCGCGTILPAAWQTIKDRLSQ